ncbi:MAG: glycerophosphodiester phosphodiesterase family protein [Actinocatenispora sp.]
MTSTRDGIRIIGHRGVMGVEPENTIRSFRRAEREGADDIELDLRLTADGHLVIMHDATVDRTTNGSGAVAELTLAEIRALDAGDGERVPTFAEVLAAVDLPIQAEIKAPEAVDAFAATVLEHALTDRVVASSFRPEALLAVAAAVPVLTRVLIFSKEAEERVDKAVSLGATWVAPSIAVLTEDVMSRCTAAELNVCAWPANTPEQVRDALALGAHAVTSDYPHLVRQWLDEGLVGDVPAESAARS